MCDELINQKRELINQMAVIKQLTRYAIIGEITSSKALVLINKISMNHAHGVQVNISEMIKDDYAPN